MNWKKRLLMGGGLAVLVIAGLLGVDSLDRSPKFGFLRGAKLINRQSDPYAVFSSMPVAQEVWAYRLEAGYEDTVRKTAAELAGLAGWKPTSSERLGGSTLGIDLPPMRRLAGQPLLRYQAFKSETSGIEIVECEPTEWQIQDRETLWEADSASHDSRVVTVFVIQPVPEKGSFESLIARFRKALGIP